ncbi:unnamed protein product, partial [Rotaria sp. Silwood1]
MKLEYGAVNATLVMDGLNYPDDLVIDSEGTMFIAEKESLTRWPKGARNGTVLGRAQWLLSVALDSKEEHLYVTDYMTTYVMNIVRVLAGSKNATIIAAGNGIGDAPDQLYNPDDLAFDSYGNLYVSDY